MMLTRFVVPLLGLVGWFSLNLAAHAAGSPDLPAASLDPASFKARMLEAIGPVEAALAGVRAEGRTGLFAVDQGPLPEPKDQGGTVFRYVRQGTREKLDYSKPEKAKSYFRRVVLKDEDHGYVLREPAEGKPFFIEVPHLPSNYESYLAGLKRLTTRAALSLGTVDIAAALRDPKFRVEQLASEVVDGHDCVRVDFQHEETARKNGDESVYLARGSFLVDPALSFAIRSYRLTKSVKTDPKLAVTAEGSVQYANTDGLPRVRSVDVQEVYSPRDNKVRRFSTVTKMAYEETPARDLTLDAYGLGDYERPLGDQPHGMVFWGLVVGATCLTLGSLFGWLHRRSRADGVRAHEKSVSIQAPV